MVSSDGEAVAIVGAGCRYPGGGEGVDGFWQLLRDGTDVISEVPRSRWDLDRYYDADPDAPGAMYTRWGGFLPDIERFDAEFFGIAPREARQMDPQQRLLLEVAWEALADAGIVPGTLAGSRTSVFTGGLGVDYFLRHARDAGIGLIDPWYATGKETSFVSGRLSYLLGAHGPSLSLNTACSSSLVAVHLARQSLLTGESDVSLVGGVNLLLSPELTVFMCKADAMSRDGRCKVFDASADGIVRSDGCAVLVLKRLGDALADGDDVLAVIRGSAVNHDGHSAGLTVPNALAQQSLLREALEQAGTAPHEVGYVEAHGTGTPLGDPIEVYALGEVLGKGRPAGAPLVVGSVKTNLGHTDAAAGLTGLLKAALVVRYGLVPPHLHLTEPNANIDWDGAGIRPAPATGLLPWPGAADRARVAGVSAFGLSGSNAHVIVESSPDPEPVAAGEGACPPRQLLLPVSARTGSALRELVRAHRDRLRALDGDPEADLPLYAATAAARRTHHDGARFAVTGTTAVELADALDGALEDGGLAGDDEGAADGSRRSVCFVFSGQGGQWPGMGRVLYEDEPVFRAALEECDELVRAEAGWSVLAELEASEDDSRLAETERAQPVVYAVQVALAALWRSWGIEPSAVVGHSMGEIAAARVAGALTPEDAVRIIVRRGRLLQAAAGRGLMASVALPEDEVSALVAPYGQALCVGAVNGPRSTVVSGDPDAVEEFVTGLRERGVNCTTVPGEYAFHSPQMAPYGAELAACLAGIRPRTPEVPLFTTTPGRSGARAPGPVAVTDAEHWARNVTEPVRFSDAVGQLLEAGHRTFVEIGPHPVLALPLTQQLEEAELAGVVVPSLRRGADDAQTTRSSLGVLYAHGFDVRWDAVCPAPKGVSKALPRYPWQGERLWFETAGPGERPAGLDGIVDAGGVTGELRFFDESGRLVAQAAGLRLSRAADGVPAVADGSNGAAATAAYAGQGTGIGQANGGSPNGSAGNGSSPNGSAGNGSPGDCGPATAAPAPAPAPAPGRAELASRTADAVARVLGFAGGSAVKRGQGFAELGMDSLGAVELAKTLERAFGIKLAKTVAFDHPTVDQLAAHLERCLPAVPAPDTAEQPAQPSADPPVEAAGQPARGGTDRAGFEPIAVVGVGCRFPGGVHGPGSYWQLLRDGVDAIGPAPAERFPGNAVWHGGFIEDVDRFDAPFFRLSPREAKVTDPQQRLFLEVAWEALEHAGQPPSALAGTRTGVFLGMNSTDYAQIVTSHPDNVDAFYGTGNSFTAAAGRFSYLLGLHGPSLAVDTACSSSLVAVHLAVASLRSGESDIALAGGVNLILRDTIHRASSASGALAADGRCKTFDASADGYTRGEGCGVVVLKPLSRAVADGDDVLALVLGSAVNQDGPSSGLTVPYGPAQEELLRTALADSRVGPGDIGYVEAHGTGTPLGDPIELQALGSVLAERGEAASCLVGSVKTNIGHLEAASGIAGMIKTVLALRHREVPPHLHFDEPSPDIPWTELPFEVPVRPTEWKADGTRRVAGVSAFGFSGTNAHVVLAEAPEGPPAPGETAPGEPADERTAGPVGEAYVLPVSAATGAALKDQARAYRELLNGPGPDGSPLDLGGLTYTAALRRSHLDHRLVVTGGDRHQLVERLDDFVAGREGPGLASGHASGGRRRGPVFVFSGHGSYWPGVGRRLVTAEPVFREAVERCDAELSAHLDWSAAAVLAEGKEPANELDQQILQFALQYALTELWRAQGLEPAAVVGHSMGEVSAALCAGALDLPQAAAVMLQRTRLLEDLKGKGGMAVVGLDAEQTEAELLEFADRLYVSVVNSYRSTVISGDSAALEEFGSRMKARNIFFREVAAGGPAHSPAVEPLRRRLVEELAPLVPAAPRLPFHSSVTGAVLDVPADAEYWGRNLRQPVRFAAAVRSLIAEGHDTFVELSPHPLQLTPIGHELEAAGVTDGVLVPSLLRDTDPVLAVTTAFGALHAAGFPVDWHRRHPGGGRLTATPRYAWQHKRYWVDQEDGAAEARPAGRHPLLAREFRTAGGASRRVVEADLDAELARALGVVPNAEGGGDPACGGLRLPSAAWLEMALAAVSDGGRPYGLQEVRFARPHVMAPETRGVAQLSLAPEPCGAFGFEVHARDGAADAPFREIGSGRATPVSARPRGDGPPPAAAGPGGDGAAPHGHEEAGAAVEEWVAAISPTLRAASVRRGPDTVEVDVDCGPPGLRWRLRPDLLEAALRLPELLPDATGAAEGATPLMPGRIGAVTVYGEPGDRVRITARRAADTPGDLCADVWLSAPDGTLLAELRGTVLTPAPGRVPGAEERQQVADSLYRIMWQESPRPVPEAVPETARDGESRAGQGGGADGASGGWLLLADRGGVAEALAEELRARGGTVRLLTADDGHSRDRITEELAALHRAEGCRGVLHLTALDLPDGTPVEADLAATAAVTASVPEVAAATAAAGGPVRVWYATRAATTVGPEEASAPLRAPVYRMAGVTGVEQPAAWGGVLDLDPYSSGPGEDAAAILDELLADDGEDHVARRGDRRLTARVARCAAPAPVLEPVALRADRTYVVAGTDSELAGTVVEWLTARGAGRVEVVGALDGPALTVSGAVTRTVKDAAERGTPVAGVVWLGVDWDLDPPDAPAPDPERTAALLAGRGLGGWLLHDICAQQGVRLDHFLIFTSVAAQWGAAGAARQAAADGLLGALAEHRRALGLPVAHIAWAPWDGVGELSEESRALLVRSGLQPVVPETGLLLLDHVTAGADPVVAAAQVDWSLLLPLYQQARPWPLFAGMAAADGAAQGDAEQLLVRLRSLDADARGHLLLECVLTEASVVLGMDGPDDLEPQQGFFETGMSSVTSLELKVRLERRFGCELPATLAFEQPTSEAVARYLAAEVLDLADADAGAGTDAGGAVTAPATAPGADAGDDELLALLDREITAANNLIDGSPS
ncbi:type I polyketide synthase [Streptomyces armeniacus]|nr:type I polyketide synthase [Streptomyces armeniacus]AWS21278.1 type I polyketide synthase [Streptomyces armeniacus]AZY91987.1 polyketide synthase [Streptomyces armeniacus]